MSESSPFTRQIFEHHMSQVPPAPVLLAQGWLDGLCHSVLPTAVCAAWRPPEDSPFGLEGILPALPTFADYRAQQSQHDENVWSSLYHFCFQESTTSLAILTSRDALMVLLVLVLGLRAIKSVLLPWFSSLGRRAGRHTHGVEWERANEVRILKFGEYVFRLCFHSVITLIGVVHFADAPWWQFEAHSTETLWRSWTTQEIGPGMIWYYLIQCAYNVDAMLSLLIISFELQKKTTASNNAWFSHYYTIGWSKNVRGDFQEMFIHHVVTNLLIFGSSVGHFQRVGSMVLLVHDVSDIPVDLSKLANFLKWKLTTAVCFANMVLVWCITRLGLLPFVIYRSIWNEAWLVAEHKLDYIAWYKIVHPVFLILVGSLIFLHLAWFTMFIQMGYVLISKGEAHDLSEHKKGEEQQQSTRTRTDKKRV